MRQMSENEEVLYNILVNNKVARTNNWEAVRMFYWDRYKVNLPDLKQLPTVWTIERSVRQLKELYKECNDSEAKKIHQEKEDEFKEKALVDNKPTKPSQYKEEQIELKWWDTNVR